MLFQNLEKSSEQSHYDVFVNGDKVIEDIEGHTVFMQFDEQYHDELFAGIKVEIDGHKVWLSKVSN